MLILIHLCIPGPVLMATCASTASGRTQTMGVTNNLLMIDQFLKTHVDDETVTVKSDHNVEVESMTFDLDNFDNFSSSRFTSFDNLLWSMLTTFQLITLDYWENVYNMVDDIFIRLIPPIMANWPSSPLS